jgi:hypothetical protein
MNDLMDHLKELNQLNGLIDNAAYSGRTFRKMP